MSNKKQKEEAAKVIQILVDKEVKFKLLQLQQDWNERETNATTDNRNSQ